MNLKLFETCIFTRGAGRAAICDTQRGEIYLIPNSFFDIITKLNGKNIDAYLKKINADNRKILNEYIAFLIGNELAFYCSSIKETRLFPSISLKWDYPFAISNMIIEVNADFPIDTIESFMNGHYPECIQFYLFFQIKNKEALETILGDLNRIKSKRKQVFFSNNCELTLEELIAYSNMFPYIEYWVASKSNKNEYYNYNGVIISMIKQKDISKLHCGIINEQYFNLELSHYTESLVHNTCLNRKIAIDAEGDIKNCPSMRESFGNIKDTTLEEAINKPGFKKYWNIKKDEITKCKDCEFRHVCTDCRAYVEHPEDIYSAPLKCGYDPYTCEWAEWSTNPLKQQAIEYYGMQELVKKV
jgi:SPASM domain peptide maturase of grasp-with-spasm system